ncbi:hypothetical protein [Actinoplanes rectilineatus]|uniref:hypothetical protein n=1 Tax=Actinoplanes rectilineatus TaxID=113571 RepID=UPI0005F2BC15|nr:hypothetical protein [Actinoplanes rectilineatus]
MTWFTVEDAPTTWRRRQDMRLVDGSALPWLCGGRSGARGIEAAADAGDPAMVRLRENGTVQAVRAAHDWTSEHRLLLEP